MITENRQRHYLAYFSNIFLGTKDDILMAYQIAFDLYESATQQFLNNILQAIKRTAPIPAAIEGKPLPGKQISEHNLMMKLRGHLVPV